MKKLTVLLMLFSNQLFSQKLSFDELNCYAIHQYLSTDSSLNGKVALLVNSGISDTSINSTLLVNEFSKGLANQKERINDGLYVSRVYHKDGNLL
jgi:hypothetical protein